MRANTIHCSKRAITLLEVLLVVIVLGALAGAVVFKLSDAHAKHRFQADVELVKDTVRLAQDILLLLDQDIKLVIARDPETSRFVLHLDMDVEIPKAWQLELLRKDRVLRAVQELSFDGEQKEAVNGALTLVFASKGSVMPKGALTLRAKDQKTTLFFPGYPAPVGEKEPEEHDDLGQMAVDTWALLE